MCVYGTREMDSRANAVFCYKFVLIICASINKYKVKYKNYKQNILVIFHCVFKGGRSDWMIECLLRKPQIYACNWSPKYSMPWKNSILTNNKN